jgi:hypothetical protein
MNNNAIMSGLNAIEEFDQNINANVNGYNTKTEDTTGMIEYKTAYNELKQ